MDFHDKLEELAHYCTHPSHMLDVSTVLVAGEGKAVTGTMGGSFLCLLSTAFFALQVN